VLPNRRYKLAGQDYSRSIIARFPACSYPFDFVLFAGQTPLLPLQLQIITNPWRTIILDEENAQPEGEGRVYSYANKTPPILLPERHSPHPSPKKISLNRADYCDFGEENDALKVKNSRVVAE
jgi:hypothetical protein